jgi:hypothetical protein
VEIRSAPRRLVLALAALGLVFSVAGSAAANPEKTFKGQIITSKQRIPTSDKSVSAYTAKLKKARSDRFYEDKAKQTWKIHYAGFFNRPLNDLEVTIRLFDVTRGGKKLITSFEQYLDGRGAKSVISNLTLERKYVGVNKQILMVMESRGTILSSGKFWILGEGEKFSGQVDFSDEEAREGVKE